MSEEATAPAPATKAPKGRKAVEKKNQVLRQLRVEYIKANTLKPNSYNPNRQSEHDFLLLIRSMLEDGFTQPIVVQKSTMEIIDGEHRWTASIVCEAIRRQKVNIDSDEGEKQVGQLRTDRLNVLAGMPDLEIPVVLTDMAPEQMRISTLRHNRARGSEDIELTAQVLRDLRELGALDWAQDSLQLDDVELDKLLEDIPVPEALAGDEFSQAWEPDKAGGEASSGDVQVGAQHAVSMSPQAVEAVRAQEQRIASAKTEEERVAAQRDADVFRLALMFTGEEAKIVRAALGAQPAMRLLEWCKANATEKGVQ